MKINELAAENRKVSNRIEELEQHQRSNNLEIKGAPTEGDATEVVKKIRVFLGEAIVDIDNDVCHRVPVHNSEEKNSGSFFPAYQAKCNPAKKQETKDNYERP